MGLFPGGGNSILPGNSKRRGVTFWVKFQGMEVTLPGNSKGCVSHGVWVYNATTVAIMSYNKLAL